MNINTPSKVDTATEADWSFVADRGVMAALESAAHKAARLFDGVVEYEDAYQDAVLWLAVRPGEVAKYRDRKGGMRSLSQNIYAALKKPAIRQATISNRTVSSELLPVVDSWADAGGGALF
jgi:hypothetical protein